MLNIEILYDSKNFTIVKDNITQYIWLYSHKKPICYYDGLDFFSFKNGLDCKQLTHIGVFKKKLKNNEI